MTLAGAGFVPCEVPYPARVLTAYPWVVRRDPHRPRHVPFGEQIGNGVPWVARKKRGGPDARALLLLFPHGGATDPFASERARACDASGAAGLCTCHEGRGPGLRNLVRHEAGPCESHGECYRSTQLRSNHVAMSGGHLLAHSTNEG